ncbi:MAG: hypothetical protein ACJARG_001814 [Arcticibacterium sp.]|jgi:hypothetical protein
MWDNIMKKGLESSIKYHKTSLWHRLIYFIKNGKSMYDGSKTSSYEMDEQALYYADKINTMEDEVGQTSATQRSTAIKRCRLKRNNFQIINNMKEEYDALEDLITCNNFIADISNCAFGEILNEFRQWQREWELYVSLQALKKPQSADDFIKGLKSKYVIGFKHCKPL